MSQITDGAGVLPAVEVQQLSRAFRGVTALDDVTLQIPVGSIFGLVGVNGAGKTTLIRHLIGSLRALHGSVRVLGHDPVQDHETVLRRVGYLTEEDILPGWMRLGELIDFQRAIYPGWDDVYANELCDMFQLTRSMRLRSLSKGSRARAALLVAIAHRPELLILDEPSSGLDPIARSDILEAVIRTISQDGRTVLFSSHLLEEVDRVCDSVALMRDGKIVESLTIEQLESRYDEIVCRPPDGWRPPTELDGLFGWQRVGSEWSVVVDTKCIAKDESTVIEQLAVVHRHNMTLPRWFAARNADPRLAGHTDSSDGVTADV